MTKGLTSLADILGDGLKTLEQRAAAAEDLGARVRATLKGAEKDHVVAANERDGTLVVVMDSAAWCPQVRYAQEALLAELNRGNATRFTKLRVRVGKG